MEDKIMRNTSRRIRRMRRERAARAYRRTVLRRLAVVFAALAIITTVGVNALTTAFARSTDADYEIVTVHQGDTLWSIAAEHNYTNRDIRAVVDKIMLANDMKSAEIRVGDRINIPLS